MIIAINAQWVITDILLIPVTVARGRPRLSSPSQSAEAALQLYKAMRMNVIVGLRSSRTSTDCQQSLTFLWGDLDSAREDLWELGGVTNGGEVQ